MTDNEKLVEEAAKAIWAATDALTWEQTSEDLRDSCRVEARAALAVFEKAHTPTDDEREALSEFLFTVYEHGSQPNALREADAILTFLAGRRSEVPEPSARQVNGEREAIVQAIDAALGYIDREAPGFVLSDGPAIEALRAARVAIVRLTTERDAARAEVDRRPEPEFVRGVIADRDAAESKLSALIPEPQGEPSEAQVEAACEAFYNDPSDITQWNRLAEFEGRIADKYRARMRAALRAAGGVR